MTSKMNLFEVGYMSCKKAYTHAMTCSKICIQVAQKDKKDLDYECTYGDKITIGADNRL